MIDHTQEILNELDPRMARIATSIIIECRNAGIPLGITADGGKRGFLTQLGLRLSGRSRTIDSQHRRGLAVDFDVLGINRDKVPEAFWRALGTYAERQGCTWGGRFRTLRDLSHIELR